MPALSYARSDTCRVVLRPSAAGGHNWHPMSFHPGTGLVYVGGSNGQLYRIDTSGASPVITSRLLGVGGAVVGAPSLDRDYDLVIVGTEAGIFYAVQIPLP